MPAGPEVRIGEDDLSRQRQKRDARLLDRPVAGFPALTLREVVTTLVAATEESGGTLDAQRYLAEQGHSWPTIETALAYVDRCRHDNMPAHDLGVRP